MTQRTDEAAVVVDYAYDTANRLTERKESGSSTDIETYVYDGLGRLITAEKGTSSNADAVAGSAFTYDSFSRVNEECQSIAYLGTRFPRRGCSRNPLGGTRRLWCR